MFSMETPKSWKSRCIVSKTEKVKDDYGSVTRKVTKSTAAFFCVLPVTDEATVKEFGLCREGSIQAAIFENDLEINVLDLIELSDGEVYEVRGIKKFPSYRLVVAKKEGL